MFGPSRSLRTKILRLALIPTVIVLIAATGITYIAYQRTLQQVMRDQYSDIAINAAARLSESLLSYGQILTGLAQEEDIRSLNLEQQRLALERWGTRLYPFDAGVAILNSKGIIVWSQPLRFDWIGRNLSGTLPFQEVRQGQSLVFSDLITSVLLMGGEVTMIGVPFLDTDGNFAGMIAGVFQMDYPQLSPIYAELLRVGLSQRSYAYLVDRAGKIIYHPDGSRVGEDISSLSVIERTLNGEAGATIVINNWDDDLVLGYSPVPASGWALIVQENWEQAMLPVRRFGGFLLVALLVGLLVPMILVYISVDRITRPIAALAEGAERIAKGEFEHAVSVHTGDELQKLAHQFNVMARRLQASYANLELKVDERTEELATLNAIAARVSQSLDPESILAGVLDELDEVINVLAGGIYLVDQENPQSLRLAAHRGLDPELVSEVSQMRRGSVLPGSVLETRTPLAVSDASSDQRLALSPFRQAGPASIACVPLQSKGEIPGALFIVAQAYREFSPEEIKLLVAIGNQVGIGVDSARLFAQEQRRRQEALALAEIAGLVSGNLDIDEILRLAVERVAAILEADRCIIFLCDEAGNRKLWPAVCCERDEETNQTVAMRLSAAPFDLADVYPFAEALRSRAPVIVTDARADRSLRPELAAILESTSLLLSPIYARDRLLGLLYLGAAGPPLRRFGDQEQTLALALCNEIAVALENASLFKDLEHRNAVLSTLNAIAAIVNQSLVLEQTLSDALAKTVELMDARAGEIRLLDTQSGRLLLRAQHGISLSPDKVPASLPLNNKLGDVVRSGEVLALDGVGGMPEYWAEVGDIRWMAILPLLAKGRVMGTMSIGRPALSLPFAADETALLLAIGDHLGIAAENLRLFDRERTRANQLRIVNQIGQHIAAILSLNELLPFVARTLQETFGYFSVSIFLLDVDAGELVLRACAGAYANQLALGARQSMEEGSAGKAAVSSEAISIRDFSQEPRYAALGNLAVSRPGIILPIRIGGRVLGILEVQSAGSRPSDDVEISHLQILADQIAIAIENAHLYEESRELAIVEERNRLARELHDSVTQSLFGIVLNAEATSSLIPTDPQRALQQVQRMQGIAQDALAEMRSLIYELRPPSLGEEDLESALRRYVEVMQARHHLDISLSVSSERSLAREYEQGLYRIAQEAIMNVVKHAEASRVDVELTLRDGSASLVVQDNGVGFSGRLPPQKERSFGLTSMRDRAELLGGMFEILSMPGEGTQVRVEIPLRSEPQAKPSGVQREE